MAGEEWTYERAGVSIDRGDQAVRRIRQLVGQTRRPEVVEDVGGFAGVFRLPGTDLVAGADGVGSKILIAEALGEYRTIGIDLVAMNVNDILAAGAEPLFFLDYIATGRRRPGCDRRFGGRYGGRLSPGGMCLIRRGNRRNARRLWNPS